MKTALHQNANSDLLVWNHLFASRINGETLKVNGRMVLCG
jgi:hypothetical protein